MAEAASQKRVAVVPKRLAALGRRAAVLGFGETARRAGVAHGFSSTILFEWRRQRPARLAVVRKLAAPSHAAV